MEKTTTLLTFFYFAFILLFTPFEVTLAQSAGCNVASIEVASVPACQSNGNYTVDIRIRHSDNPPGTGTVVLVANGSPFSTPIEPDGDNEQIIPVELIADGASVDVVAYYSVDPNCRTIARDLFVGAPGCGSIGDFVWLDLNKNGLQDPGEPGLSGITVSLVGGDCDPNGSRQQITDADGAYLFESLCPGEYQVIIDLPDNNRAYDFSPFQAGNDPEIDNDITENGMSAIIQLSEGEHFRSLDVGITECPSLSGLVCNNALNISLGTACESQITPELLIEGAIPCNVDFDLRLFDDTGFIGDILTSDQVGKTVTAIVEDRVTGLACSTELFVTDDIGPEIECLDQLDAGFRPDTVQFFSGELTNDDLNFDAASIFCWPGLNTSGNNFYDTLSFEVSENDIYNLVLFTDWEDGAAAIYHNEFSAIDPCLNLIHASAKAFDPDEPISFFETFGAELNNWVTANMKPVVQLALPLRKGSNLQLVTSSAGPDQSGNYTWAVFSAQNGRIIRSSSSIAERVGNLQFDIICTDFDSLFNNESSLSLFSPPILADNCSETIDLRFSDAIKRKSFCGPNVIQRTFTAVDESGNESQCIQELTANNPGPMDLTLPPEVVFLSCDEGFPLDEAGNPSPEASGFPFVWTLYGVQPVEDAYCNVSAGYEDEVRIENCDGSYTVFRKWIIVDFCNPFNRRNYEQVIKVVDEEAPNIDLTAITYDNQQYPDTLIYSTGPFDCTGAMEVPLPEITDNCSGQTELLIEVVTEVEVDILDIGVPVGTRIDTQTIATVLPGEQPVVFGIPQGCHWFRYTVTDDCGNTAVAAHPFCVEDQIAPIAICEDNLTISVGGQGVARLLAEVADKGSYDACELDGFEVRREYKRQDDCSLRNTPAFSAFGPFVEFDCCDIGDTVRVEFLVKDKAGNANTCWLEVYVEDKIRPICIAPPATDLKCYELPANFDPNDKEQLATLFGEPANSDDNCEVIGYEELDPLIDLDDCQVGRITRRFRVFDKANNFSTNICTQIVDILPEFDYEIRFPADLRVNCEVPEPEEVFIAGLGCDLLATQIEDETFSAGQGDCYKVFRTYSIINWCEYDSESAPVVINRNEDCDGLPGDEAVWVLRRPDQAFIDRDNDETNQNPLFATKPMDCDEQTNPEGYWRTVNPNGYWVYTQVITVYDDTPPTLTTDAPEPFCSLNNEECTGPTGRN